ncbi:MAG: STAS domain-containing protein [Cyanothece sp. SIO2G6]|nr:STAS domain-containing protein [Cyanothece sp. SIO2G6]
MKLELKKLDNDILLVSLMGRLDLKGTLGIDDEFRSHVAASKQNTIVDMGKVHFLASIGMRMLLSNAKALQQRKKQMVLVNPQPMVKDALKMSGIFQLIPVFDTVNEAIATFEK